MDKVFFRIIIPNYNNYIYIRRCLDSILSQSFQDFKIIIVDDQSTDNSYRICKIYEKRHPDKIVVLKPDEKLYAGGCRNVGMDYPLDSEYTWFIDGDDYITIDALQIIYDNLKNGTEMLLFNAIQKENGKEQNYINDYHFSLSDNNQITLSPFRVPWIKVIKSNKVERFLDKSLFGEDSYQWILQLDKITSFEYIDNSLYTYNIIPNSLTHGNPLRNTHKTVFIDAIKTLYDTLYNQHLKQSILNRLKDEGEVSYNIVFHKNSEIQNKILLLTSGSINLKYQYTITNINKQKYCEKYNIDYIFNEDESDIKKSYHTRKTLIRDWIQTKRYDWIMWMDCDAWFNNFDVNVNDMINNIADGDTHLILCNDCITQLRKNWGNYHDCYVNSGVMIFRSSDMAIKLIDIWKNPSQEQIIWMKRKTNLNDQPFLASNIMWNDTFKHHTKVIDFNIMNTFVGYDDINYDTSQNFIYHAAGRNKPKKLFDKWVEKYEIIKGK